MYRTGGDEFIAIVHVSDCGALLRKIQKNASEWKGNLVDAVSISLGCASHGALPEASIEELERISDARMYEDKERYYREIGYSRGGK